jgi:GntR family galactonate operon transcriptional repressor
LPVPDDFSGTASPNGWQGNRTQRATHDLGVLILSGSYPPGTALPIEAELCTALGVGRNVMREAVKTLVGKGLLRTARRGGTIVRPREDWSWLDTDTLTWALEAPSMRAPLLQDLAGLRMMIEPEVAAITATNATTVETLRIFEAFESMRQHVNDPQEAIEADIAFHERVFAASHNRLAATLLRVVTALLRANFELTIRQNGAFIRNLDEHLGIARAIQARDANAARQETRKLLLKNEDDLRTMIDLQNGSGPRGGSGGGPN